MDSLTSMPLEVEYKIPKKLLIDTEGEFWKQSANHHGYQVDSTKKMSMTKLDQLISSSGP